MIGRHGWYALGAMFAALVVALAFAYAAEQHVGMR